MSSWRSKLKKVLDNNNKNYQLSSTFRGFLQCISLHPHPAVHLSFRTRHFHLAVSQRLLLNVLVQGTYWGLGRLHRLKAGEVHYQKSRNTNRFLYLGEHISVWGTVAENHTMLWLCACFICCWSENCVGGSFFSSFVPLVNNLNRTSLCPFCLGNTTCR